MIKRKDSRNKKAGIQFSISHELLLLLEGLLQSRDSFLNELIHKAIESGLVDIKHSRDSSNKNVPLESVYSTLFEFFTTVEEILHDAICKEVKKQLHEKITVPVLNQIDTSICSRQVICSSMEVVIRQNSNDSDKKIIRDELMREVLKRWNPTSGSVQN